LHHLSEQYKESIKIIRQRLKELNVIKLELQSKSTYEDIKKDPAIVAIKLRIAPLRLITGELSMVEKEVRNYYESGWWRSPLLTMNQNKGIEFTYSEAVYDD
jgi:hypothetical protein